MDNQIICPNCKKAIPLNEALSSQIQEKYQKFYKIRLAEEKAKIEIGLKESLTKDITEKMQMDLKNKANESEELKKQNKALQEQLLELNKLLRQLRVEMDQKKLELEKKLVEDQEKIRNEEKKRVEDEYKFKILEKDKKLDDAMNMADEYKRKLEQGSQQLQGEVLELEIENMLKQEFRNDEILDVPKGIRGADVMQIVKNNYGKSCGTIIWESKRTKAWSDSWLTKLKEDQRDLKAEIAVIISQVLPSGIKKFGLLNGVWVCDFDSIIGLATALRITLVEVSSVKVSNENRQGKMEILYNYFSGIEFKQRLEAIVEAFNGMQENIETEKRWFAKKWAKEEKDTRKFFDNISGMYGDLSGMMGKALPDVRGLNMLEQGKNDQESIF
jgi:hypothetical protein